MRHCLRAETSSRFARSHPGGSWDYLFRLLFPSDEVAARYFYVSQMTVWRWRHDRVPLPRHVAEQLLDLVADWLRRAADARQHLASYVTEPPPLRKLSGCCAGRERRM